MKNNFDYQNKTPAQYEASAKIALYSFAGLITLALLGLLSLFFQ